MVEVLKRPAFLLGTTTSPRGPAVGILPPPRRVIEQGKRLGPFGFKRAPPRGRTAVGVAESEARRIRREGIKVALGESTLAKLLDVQVPIKDAAGRNLLDSAGKPIMKTVRVNIGNLSKSFIEKLDIIQTAISEGATVNRDGLAKVTTLILSMDIASLKGRQREQLATTLLALNYSITELFNDITGKLDGRFITGPAMRQGLNKKNIAIFGVYAAKDMRDGGAIAPVTITAPFIGTSGRAIYVDSVDRFLNRGDSIRNGAVLDLITLQVFPSLTDARAAVGVAPRPEKFPEEKVPPLDVSGSVDVDDLIDRLEFSPGALLSTRQIDALADLPKSDATLLEQFAREVVDDLDQDEIANIIRHVAAK